MESAVKFEFNSAITGNLKYLSNGNLVVKNATVNKEFTHVELTEIAKAYKGANRIHKPMALLFWTDCKNGNFNNWK